MGAKKAREPLHVQYSYDDRSVSVVNSLYHPGIRAACDCPRCTIAACTREDFPEQIMRDVEADGVARILTFPRASVPAILAGPIFVKVWCWRDRGGEVRQLEFLLAPRKAERLMTGTETTYRYTPLLSYEDLTALQALPKAGPITASAEVAQRSLVRVRLQNPSGRLAFQIRLGIGEPGRDEEIVPVLWGDNYVDLMPGESREITARLTTPRALGAPAELRISGWNVEPTSVLAKYVGGRNSPSRPNEYDRVGRLATATCIDAFARATQASPRFMGFDCHRCCHCATDRAHQGFCGLLLATKLTATSSRPF